MAEDMLSDLARRYPQTQGPSLADLGMLPPPANPVRGASEMTLSALAQPFKDAYSALRGRMTENEAQDFAVTAALGILPMGRGLQGVRMGTMAAPRAANYSQPGIRAYHGSPHDFERFDLSKIGTGEGAQAYGHGLYFAENPATAKAYRESLALRHKGMTIEGVSGKRINDLTGAERQAYAMLANDRGDIDQSIRRSASAMNADEVRTVLERWKTDGRFEFPKGRMYEVNIKAKPEEFLDWDKPLAAQTEPVRRSLEEISSRNPEIARRIEGVTIPRWQMGPGRDLYSAVGRGINRGTGPTTDKLASEQLREYGIPGIRYLDQGSRGSGQGTNNYVVFDDKLIDILKKYGLAGATGPAAGASLADLAQQPQ